MIRWWGCQRHKKVRERHVESVVEVPDDQQEVATTSQKYQLDSWKQPAVEPTFERPAEVGPQPPARKSPAESADEGREGHAEKKGPSERVARRSELGKRSKLSCLKHEKNSITQVHARPIFYRWNINTEIKF